MNFISESGRLTYMDQKLVIVESPAKAKTIGKMLGRDYTIKASMGTCPPALSV